MQCLEDQLGHRVCNIVIAGKTSEHIIWVALVFFVSGIEHSHFPLISLVPRRLSRLPFSCIGQIYNVGISVQKQFDNYAKKCKTSDETSRRK